MRTTDTYTVEGVYYYNTVQIIGYSIILTK